MGTVSAYKTDRRNRHFWKMLVFALLGLYVPVCLCGCGYSEQEKAHRKEIAALGEENAGNYIRNKYGFTPVTDRVELCEESGEGRLFPPATGDVLVFMRYGDETFTVCISGEKRTAEGKDDFQHSVIAEDAKTYMEALLGYEIYDLYVEYKEKETDGHTSSDAEERNLIRERYEPGHFGQFLQQYPVSIRIDDCKNQDLTTLSAENPATAAFLKKCAEDYGMRAVLISYRSAADYENGYTHTYGRGGLLDFEICNDGLYIRSYAAFAEEGAKAIRFELQEFDGMVFSCDDKAAGADLALSKGQREWLDLGETKGGPRSPVYSVGRDGGGEVVVYIPAEQLARYGGEGAVYIQHLYENKWWQYEDYLERTMDKKYVFITYQGVGGSSFDFAVF